MAKRRGVGGVGSLADPDAHLRTYKVKTKRPKNFKGQKWGGVRKGEKTRGHNALKSSKFSMTMHISLGIRRAKTGELM